MILDEVRLDEVRFLDMLVLGRLGFRNELFVLAEIIEVEERHAAGFADVFRQRCLEFIHDAFQSSGILLRRRTVAKLRYAIFWLQNPETPNRGALIQYDAFEKIVR